MEPTCEEVFEFRGLKIDKLTQHLSPCYLLDRREVFFAGKSLVFSNLGTEKL